MAATDWFVEHTGQPPRWFRPGTAHCDDVAADLARRLEQPVVGFSVNVDHGATAGRGHVAAALLGMRPRDIAIAHVNRPSGQTAEGLADALPVLLDRGARFTTLGAALA